MKNVNRFGRYYIGTIFSLSLALLLALLAHRGRPIEQTTTVLEAPAITASLVFAARSSPSPTLIPMTPTAMRTATPSPTVQPTSVPLPISMPSPTPTASPSPTPEPLPTPDGVSRTLAVPILMYHYISRPPDPTDAVREDLSVPPEAFEEHLRFLQERGYTSISLREFMLALTTGYPLPPKPIVLTFDDGYRDHYENAFRLLKQYGFTGTFFLITSLIDEQDPRYLTWDQVIEMHAAGMEMESHGYTHDDLRNRSPEYLIWQMLGSKEAIEARTGEPVRLFCYPSGHYDALGIEILRQLGYWGAVTTKFGLENRSEDTFELRRLRIHGDYGVTELAALLGEPLPLDQGTAP